MKIVENFIFLANIFLLILGHLQDGYSKLKYGYRLDRKMINSFTGYSILDCVEECLRTTRCKSVSYYKGANYCEINYENKTTAPDRYEQDTGWIYSEKEHWDKNITGACMNANCLDNQKCNPLPFGKYECIPSDCGIPYVEGADINSSDRWDAIGIRRQMHLKCYKEFKQTGSGILSCPTSGIWTADLRCDSEWMIYEDHIYLLLESNLTWHEAKEKCEEFKAYLAEINSESENIWITEKLLRPFFGKPTGKNEWLFVLWIGANDKKQANQERTFSWSKSNTLLDNNSYTNWYITEPNNAGNNEDCVIISLDLNGTWNDCPCSWRRPFVCEKELKSFT